MNTVRKLSHSSRACFISVNSMQTRLSFAQSKERVPRLQSVGNGQEYTARNENYTEEEVFGVSLVLVNLVFKQPLGSLFTFTVDVISSCYSGTSPR